MSARRFLEGVLVAGGCGARAVFWPDVEACDAECVLEAGHGVVHEDAVLGEWSEEDLATFYPDDRP